ncbi:hypothetical protein F2P81_016235 [Scophthalmus maximus]|uniref:Uncharacterized protein n=1 Tax=Scophthalmus maximus TaxID=52904 RepID=A0A6A4SIH4_SCOMX|nr:hypothetical protein F2P81_016235 [Scophthalmus maximus]
MAKHDETNARPRDGQKWNCSLRGHKLTVGTQVHREDKSCGKMLRAVTGTNIGLPVDVRFRVTGTQTGQGMHTCISWGSRHGWWKQQQQQHLLDPVIHPDFRPYQHPMTQQLNGGLHRQGSPSSKIKRYEFVSFGY